MRINELHARDEQDTLTDDLAVMIEDWDLATKELHALPADVSLADRVTALKRVERTQLQVALQAKALITRDFARR